MDRRQEPQDSSPERINDFLRRFKSSNLAPTNAQADSEDALDQYLLEKTAEELRAARTRTGIAGVQK